MIIETERLTLRPIDLGDAYDIFLYRSDKEVNKYQDFVPTTWFEVDGFINNTVKEVNLPNTWFQLVLELKPDKQVIGDIGINFTNKKDEVAIGYTLSKAHQGKGYAHEAVSTVINYLFKELSKKKIVAYILPENASSIKLIKKLGFKSSGEVDKYGDLTFELTSSKTES